ncbi:MAG: rhodanese-like domain-containing protein [Bacteroidota bacterium]|nr:rhodanese-like domain-containing protein [Bacteroidota bacterium]
MKELLSNPQTSILDVRTAMEFEMEHINGAKNIPVNEIQFRLDEIKNLSQPIVVYCLSGGRSAMAASILKQAGINEVYNGGGISNIKHVLYN